MEEQDLEHRFARRRRIRVIMIGVPGMFGSLVLLVSLTMDPFYLYEFYGIPRETPAVIAGVLFGISLIGAMQLYLQTGFKKDTVATTGFQYVTDMQMLRRQVEHLRRQVEQVLAKELLPSALAEFQKRFSNFEEQLSDLRQASHGISDAERDRLAEQLRRSIEARAKEDVLEDIKSTVRESLEREETELELKSRFGATLERLNTELGSLTRRGNLNLSLGIITALAGIGLLGIFVLRLEPAGGTPWGFAESFVPRISLVILIEIFAYFFLRLYSTSLREIKYFQNEITNVEAKYLALQAAISGNDEKVIAEVIAQLAQTERNYILEKGQTTVDIERSKLDKETITSLTQYLFKLFPRKP